MDSVKRKRERVHTFSEVGCEVVDTIQNKKKIMCQSTVVQHIKISPLESLD
jgi:hypothetical protein